MRMMKRILFLLIIALSCFAWKPPPLSGLILQESYLFRGSRIRHTMLRFPMLGVEISKHCLHKNGTSYSGRKCKAWRLYHMLSEKKPHEILTYVEKQYVTTFREFSNLACQKASGYIETEENEYNPFARDTQLLDFCVFSDGSMASIRSIRKFVLRNR